MADEVELGHRGRLRDVGVLLVLPSRGLGGAERQAFLLGRHLRDHEGARVRAVAATGRGAVGHLCESFGIPWESFRFWHESRGRSTQVADVLRFCLFLRRLHVDVLLPYCMFQNVLCALTWRAGATRVCIWNQRDEGRSELERWIERLAVRRVRCFVSNSLHGARFLTEDLGVPAERIHVVHNGVELSQAIDSRSSWRTRLGVPEGALLACMVANLHQYKDHATLVAAWRHVTDRLRQDGKEAHLVLAGGKGDRYESTMRLVHELHLTENVHAIGQILDVSGLLGASDIAIFSSNAEGVPNAVLEAMAAGLAVVGTDYPGIREAVGPSGATLLARPRDPVDLAEKLIVVAGDAHIRLRAGTDGRARAASEFGVERMCAEMVERILTEWG
jgi:glycosyltransferase involved in cell wall biosynthesis